ncbi:tRNA(fMet)-specific endonuclease VapC (plasmid) [Phaeobacter piscinae]|uniref:Ribonuclease VapC n=1 Tax=Phaeobacter piscinae TaxID=1580596 RepID=A0ABM6PK00_9RHOB|nr:MULTISPECIES: type II toxin-antitoxin system VapC family toxin [Phaeobacter]ATG38112.1 tRNA(fMet)-specific endonuclease VapC [Phaeobacter piscinae]AUQ88633.1 tRNA(fMet)-specific endonuclease VapC [Phaeobacter piscinae]AUQ92632.1 tRNA(fMet)-specific endonuclease VapC [Phaeobacter inhibens]AUR26438.1 tRNA(fMet)-specific endonuclease VapC [Phaeobacter piscinae]
MKFLLDTNAVIAIIAGNSNVIARLSEHAPKDFGVPSVVMHELYFGAYKSKKVEANLARIEALRFEVLDLSESDARAAGEIRADLKRQGTPIGPYDVLIAGQAVARSLVLVTNNVKEFRRVSGLQYEDWQ